MGNDALFSKITTDAFLFEMEPGNASRTKFAVAIANDLGNLDLDALSEDARAEALAIKKRVYEFLT